ncbi:MAG: hypothetical protein ACYTE3_06405 [Planctomycetota bacterium]|jgi:hypothetical protein
MEDMSYASQIRCLLAPAVICLSAVVPAYSDTGTEKGSGKPIRIPLELARQSEKRGDGWKVVRFKNIPANKWQSDEDGLHARVQHSADLLAYCFEEQKQVRRILLRGSVTGLPIIPKGQMQGDEKADDFAIRFGLVVTGKRRLGRRERFFAPELVKRLSELVPKSQGIDHVLFLNLANDPGPKWRKRIHRLGKGMIREQIACIRSRPGQFTIDVQFDKPLKVLALCIVSDGDHTKSKFQVTVKDIQLNPELKKKLTSIDAQIIEPNEQRW